MKKNAEFPHGGKYILTVKDEADTSGRNKWALTLLINLHLSNLKYF